MRIDLSCPAEIVRIEPPEKDSPYGLITLFNMDSRSIVSCEVTLRLLDENGGERGRAVHRARALAGRPHTAFRMSVPLEAPEVPVRGEATLDKVWFEDNDVWRKNAEREIEYTDNALPPGNLLNALKFAAGEDAVGFPGQQPDLWVCVCGRPNPNRETMCLRCQRPKSMIFNRFNRGEVERAVALRQRQLDLESRSAREEANRLQRLREEEYNREQKRARRRKRAVLALAAALVLCAAVLFVLLPSLRLLSAKRQLEAGEYGQAMAVLSELGSFPGAESAKADCEMRLARRDAAEAKDPEILKAAAEKLRGGDGADQSLAEDADFARASLLLEAGDFAGAQEIYSALRSDYPGREERLKECAYAAAAAALESREYDRARALFESLGDFRDAADQAKACVYEPALTLLEEGRYDEAIAAFSGIEGYLDSGEQIRKSWYLKGFTLEQAGQDAAAREAYVLAGSYEDAYDRASAILMAQADALAAAGEYAAAIPLYQELKGYGESLPKWQYAAYTLSAKYFKSKEFHSIIELIDALPEQNEDTERIRTKAIYQAGKVAYKEEKWAEAAALLERIPDYQDAENLLKRCRYEMALLLLEEEKWAEAAALLEQTGNYRQTEKLLKQAREKLLPGETEAPAAAETPAAETAAAAETPKAETQAAAETPTEEAPTEEAPAAGKTEK